MILSVIIPALNEEAMIARTIRAVLVAADDLDVEVIVVDNGSRDFTRREAERFADVVRVVDCDVQGAAAARNCGVDTATGDVFVFVDADTLIDSDALRIITDEVASGRSTAGMAWLCPVEPGLRGRLWWSFWSRVRTLPIPRAKAMSALMFCTRDVFAKHGPFNTQVSIGEEWPILAGAYRDDRSRFYYRRSLIAYTSSRRMELQRWGYVRTFAQYVAAIVIPGERTRRRYPSDLRQAAAVLPGGNLPPGALADSEAGT